MSKIKLTMEIEASEHYSDEDMRSLKIELQHFLNCNLLQTAAGKLNQIQINNSKGLCSKAWAESTMELYERECIMSRQMIDSLEVKK